MASHSREALLTLHTAMRLMEGPSFNNGFPVAYIGPFNVSKCVKCCFLSSSALPVQVRKSYDQNFSLISSANLLKNQRCIRLRIIK